MRISDFQGGARSVPRWLRREAAKRDYREQRRPGWADRRMASGREAREAARALRAAERLLRLRAARAKGAPAPRAERTSGAPPGPRIRPPGIAARAKTLGAMNRRIVRVELREDGREWSYHATKGWRSRRVAPAGGLV